MCFLVTDPDLIIDEPDLESTNLNMNNQRETLSENEAAPIHQRYEPRDFKDLTGHNYPTIPPDFKPVLTIPWTERPDQGISNLPEDLTIIERFTTITRPEQSILTSVPRRLTPGTEIEIVTIIDGTKFIPPSSTSDVTNPSQGSENTSLKETTDVPSLSTETALLTSSFYTSSEESSWTTSYTTASSTELLPSSSPASPSETPAHPNAAIVAGAVCTGLIIIFIVIVVCCKLWRRLETPKPRIEPQYKLRHVLRHEPQYGLPRNLIINNGPQNHVEVQPQQLVPDYGWKA